MLDKQDGGYFLLIWGQRMYQLFFQFVQNKVFGKGGVIQFINDWGKIEGKVYLDDIRDGVWFGGFF